MDEQERKIRAQIAYDIRAELVCCDMYDTVQKVDKVMQEKGDRLWEPESVIKGYHAICHWGECAARIAEEPPNYHTPDGLCGDRSDHEPHIYDSGSLGTFWCTADQKSRLPFAAEMRNK